MKFVIFTVFIFFSMITAQDEGWLDDCLNAHNDFRASQGKPPLVLNQTIIDVAQAFADQLSSECGFDHSKNPDYGENLAAGNKDCKASVKQWTDEMAQYDPNNPGFSMETGHYTQVVWKATTDLGCGIAPHCKYEYVTVCNYWAPGNYDGQFSENV